MAGMAKKTIEEKFLAQIRPLREALQIAEETVRVVKGKIGALESAMESIIGSDDDEETGNEN